MKILYSIVTFILLTVSSMALSHTGLQSSIPKNGDKLAHSPESLNLTFTKEVRLIRVIIVDVHGKDIKTDFVPSKTPASSFDVDFRLLEKSDYRVNWIAMGADGHKVRGTLSFSVQSQSVSKEVSADKDMDREELLDGHGSLNQ